MATARMVPWKRTAFSRATKRPKKYAFSRCGRPSGESLTVIWQSTLSNPSAAEDNVPVIEDSRLSRCNGALRLVKRNRHFITTGDFELGRGRFVTVPDLHLNSHGLV